MRGAAAGLAQPKTPTIPNNIAAALALSLHFPPHCMHKPVGDVREQAYAYMPPCLMQQPILVLTRSHFRHVPAPIFLGPAFCQNVVSLDGRSACDAPYAPFHVLHVCANCTKSPQHATALVLLVHLVLYGLQRDGHNLIT